ncbi:hypothetical protein NQ317_000750 [Molorchus minor]|uniref:DUF5641 domain-containing protein n=1 Tax=Molorchus minor TaxID=1323400 RepID=A0ABQ9J6I6_9CUCU|nr:hypothetical protein NQ317_000750 [Molorchus minor]
MRCEDIDDLYTEFQTYHNEIIGLIESDEVFNSEDVFRRQVDEYYYAIKSLKHELFSLNESSVANTLPNTSQARSASNIRLPKITIPTFDGNFKNWPSFYDLYNSLIHTNGSLSNIEKFQYLITFLIKEPLNLLKSILLTEDNYEIAFETLVKRYQNKRLLATAYWNEINTAPYCKTSSSKDLRKLLDTFSENIAALKNLKLPVDQWDFVLFNLLLQKIDYNTRTSFEVEFGDNELPTYQNLLDFLNNQCKALESVHYMSQKPQSRISSPNSSNFGRNIGTSSVGNSSNSVRGSYPSSFVANTSQGIATVRTSDSPNNHSNSVSNSSTASFSQNISPSAHNPPATSSSADVQSINAMASVFRNRTTVLLSTCVVDMMDCRGNFQPIRALLDSASQACFISERCLNRLGLPRRKFSAPVYGLNQSSSSSNGLAYCTIKPQGQSEPCFSFEALVLSQLCNDMPSIKIEENMWPRISNLKLADKTYHTPGPIDMLIGAEIFSDILKSGRIQGGMGEPTAFETVFGWVLLGKIQDTSTVSFPNSIVTCCTSTNFSLEAALTRFWELESVANRTHLSPDDEKCENLFIQNVSRDSTAIRTIRELATLEKEHFPQASQILLDDVFVDDIVSGSSSIESAISLRNDLIKLLKSGGFELRKWASNSPHLLSSLPESDCQLPVSFEKEEPSHIKVLGLRWNPSSDTFSYSCQVLDRPCTKRNLLSDIARIFDPLGFLSPISLFAKHIMQRLWTSHLDWDELVSPSIADLWTQFKIELPYISQLQLPRRIVSDEFLSCEIHGYSDASEKGYAAVVYFRVTLPTGDFKSFLITGKSKVAPLKVVSLPRLELCGATLLADLISYTVQTYSKYINFSGIYAYSDSQVTLAWLSSSPHRWKSFVANRASHVQKTIPKAIWLYIPSAENPADCASRGLTPQKLLEHTLWWNGPPWLVLARDEWPKSLQNVTVTDNSDVLQEEKHTVLSVSVEQDNILALMEQFSSLPKIQRIVSYCKRIAYNYLNPLNPRIGIISPVELQESLFFLIKKVQKTEFSDIISKLQHNRLLPKEYRKLALFIDGNDIIRVGGRLRNSQLSFDEKHPALLPRSHRLTELLIYHVHNENLHPGLNTLHYLLNQQFWILSPRRAIQHVLSKCFRCFRRWKSEYLNTLQQRSKWTVIPDNIKVNTLVLIKNDTKPCLQWDLGRVVQLHPGKDGHIRVVTVRTAQGQFLRPIVKLCPLPNP